VINAHIDHLLFQFDNMNDTDRQILALLRDNGRMSVTEIAQKARVSRATVQKRIEMMETEGVITGYTVKIRPGVEKIVSGPG